MNGRSGTVHIVGAGPGDPNLLTLKAKALIETADVILHDSLVGPEIIADLPQEATVIDVGKRADGNSTSQDEINQRMVTEANRGRTVVRLKGGDPTIFGRGGEEAEHLANHNIPIEIVPGVTSVVAAPEILGIPLTHRQHASSVTVITGHENPKKEESSLDWQAIARNVTAGGTLIILMTVRRLPAIMETLSKNGVPSETRVAVIESATLPDEFSITGSVTTIAEKASATNIQPPAVTVVGSVVEVGESIVDCFEHIQSSLTTPVESEAEVNH